MPHESTFIRTGLRPLIKNLKEQIKAIPETATGVGRLENAAKEMEELAKRHDKIFGPDGDRETDDAGYREFSDQCNLVFSTLLDELPGLMTNDAVTNPDVIRLCGELSGAATRRLRLEMSSFTKEIVPPRDWELTEEQQQEADFLLEGLKAKVLRQGVFFPEDREEQFGDFVIAYTENDEIIEVTENKEICLTGDRNDLAAFYVKNAGRLTPENKAYLQARIENSFYLDEVERESREQERLPIFPAEETKNGARLDGYQGLYQHQSTGNGCWSCAYAMLLQSRGVRLDQRMVRYFRPEVGVNEISGTTLGDAAGILSDDVFSPFELADLTGKVLPGTALRQVSFFGLNTPKKRADAYQAARENIMEALLVHRSPVALRNGGHFVTIVGIEGDQLKILNSLGDESKQLEDTVSLKSVIDRKELSLTFLQDLEFDAEGRCTNLPPEFTRAEYQDRKLINPSPAYDALNKAGGTFETVRTTGSITYENAIYLPREVPVVQRVLDGPEAGENEQPQQAQEPQEAQPQETMDSSIPEGAEPAAEAPDTALREKIQAVIEEDYAQLRQVVLDASSTSAEKTDMTIADPENALRYTLANLMAHKTMLEAYDHTNVPEKDTLFEPQVQSARMVESIMETRTFKRYFEDLTMGALAELVDQPPEKQNAAIERAYRSFVNSVEPAQAQKKPHAAENAKSQRKDEPSMSAKQKI